MNANLKKSAVLPYRKINTVEYSKWNLNFVISPFHHSPHGAVIKSKITDRSPIILGKWSKSKPRMVELVFNIQISRNGKRKYKSRKTLKTKPTANDLFYPAMPSLEETRQNESEEEARKRDIRNQRRKIDWENECKQVEYRGPYIGRYPWEEADTKIKSLLYLSIGAEGTRILHQNNPHTKIDTCTTYEFAHELSLTFTKPRNTTYDRFQIINARHEPHESLETFYSRLRELGAKAALGAMEQDLVKDFFIGKMNNTAIQMELLSETRTPAQALNYALSRERGQQNQKEILRGNNSNWSTTVAHLSSRKSRPAILPTPQSKQYPQCWRCGGSFIPNHLNNCPAKVSYCNICKKPGHFAKLCRSQIPPLPRNRGQFQQRQQMQTRNVKNITEEGIQEIELPLEEEYETETKDPEQTIYIRELMEDWSSVNLIEREFKSTKNSFLNNKTPTGEIIIQTKTENNFTINWLADTGSPRSFIDMQTAKELLQQNSQIKIEKYNNNTKFKCFNNNDIPIIGQLQLEINSGSWTATNCIILVVEHKSQNLMGRDILAKLGLTLVQQHSNKGKKILNINDTTIEQNITKWIFSKYPHLCTRLGRSKHHIAKSILKKEKTPTQHKGRRVLLHLVWSKK